jgi:protein-disulfide isomerase
MQQPTLLKMSSPSDSAAVASNELPAAAKAAAEKAVNNAVKETQEKTDLEEGEVAEDEGSNKTVTVFNDAEHFVSRNYCL